MNQTTYDLLPITLGFGRPRNITSERRLAAALHDEASELLKQHKFREALLKYYFAVTILDRVIISVDPKNPELPQWINNKRLSEFQIALCYIKLQDYINGFRQNMVLQHLDHITVRKFYHEKPLLPKQPGSCTNKTLLIYYECGIGDCIMYMRFVPDIIERYNPKLVYFEVPNALRWLVLKSKVLSDPRIRVVGKSVLTKIENNGFDRDLAIFIAVIQLE